MSIAQAKTAGQALAMALAGGARQLAEIPGIDHAREARLLLAQASDLPHERLHDLELGDFTPELMARFHALLTRRAAREPMSHILGRRMFWGRDFAVTPDVLDPRPETETLIEAALNVPFCKVLDLGVGSGAILLTLLAENVLAKGLGTDLSAQALNVAQRNAEALGVAARARFCKAHWYDGIDERFDLIVSNPPYITQAEMADLAPEVRDHDPHIALTPGGDGLAPYRILAAQAAGYLAPGGRLLAEFGWRQGGQVRDIFAGHGWQGLRILTDLEGRDRVILAQIAP